MDLYLKAPTEEDMMSALIDSEVINSDGDIPIGISIHHIGPFIHDDIEYLDWHTNLRGSFTDEQLELLAPLMVEPTIPYRIWA